MSATDYLTKARKELDALEALLNSAAARHRPADEILDEALAHLREARQIIDSTMDDDGTE
jgi:hypothetical protein